MSAFKSNVMKEINKEFPGLFKLFRDPTFLTTSTGQQCAVFINQGLTCTDVILYYWDPSSCKVKKFVKTFLFVAAATKFAAELTELIPQKRYADAAWQAAQLVSEGVKVFRNQNERQLAYN